MPWKEMKIMEQRWEFVREYMSGEWEMSELCRRHGISRPTGYKWLSRYEEEGMEGLRDLSRAPHENPRRHGEEMRELMLLARAKHPNWGPKKLVKWSLDSHPEVKRWPWASTVGEWLKSAGLSKKRRRRCRATPTETGLTEAESCNQVWHADYKGWFRTGDGKRCDPLTISEGYSRSLLRCQGYHQPKMQDAMRLFRAVFEECGLPEVIRTDNGAPFASAGLAGLSRLSMWWMKLGIVPERIEPGKPQQNGVHERMHRTLKEETQCPPERNLRAQQRRFEAFQKEYNEERPHEALGMKTPAEFYEPSPRKYPSREPVPEYDYSLTIRRVKRHGEICWKGERIFLSEVLAGEPVGLEQEDERYWRIDFCAVPVAILDDRESEIIRPGTPAWRRYHARKNASETKQQEQGRNS